MILAAIGLAVLSQQAYGLSILKPTETSECKCSPHEPKSDYCIGGATKLLSACEAACAGAEEGACKPKEPIETPADACCPSEMPDCVCGKCQLKTNDFPVLCAPDAPRTCCSEEDPAGAPTDDPKEGPKGGPDDLEICVQVLACGSDGVTYPTPCDVPKGVDIECRRECPCETPELKAPDCEAPIMTGPCRAAFPRWAYSDSKCVQFLYGGCQGNSNNFESMAECEAACGGGKLEELKEPEDCCPVEKPVCFCGGCLTQEELAAATCSTEDANNSCCQNGDDPSDNPKGNGDGKRRRRLHNRCCSRGKVCCGSSCISREDAVSVRCSRPRCCCQGPRRW